MEDFSNETKSNSWRLWLIGTLSLVIILGLGSSLFIVGDNEQTNPTNLETETESSSANTQDQQQKEREDLRALDLINGLIQQGYSKTEKSLKTNLEIISQNPVLVGSGRAVMTAINLTGEIIAGLADKVISIFPNDSLDDGADNSSETSAENNQNDQTDLISDQDDSATGEQIISSSTEQSEPFDPNKPRLIEGANRYW